MDRHRRARAGGRIRSSLSGVDDAAFVAALINRLVAQGTARARGIVLVGLSNGASFAERLARHGLVASAGVVLVCGTAREASRRQAERPVRPIAVLCLAGTADPMLPWNGGRGIGPLAWMGRRRARRLLLEPGRREAVAPKVLAADWAAVNGCAAAPAKEPAADGEFPVERLTWSAPGRPPVVLYRIVGGGHGWPGGPQYLPAALVGRIPRQLDATSIALDFARSAT